MFKHKEIKELKTKRLILVPLDDAALRVRLDTEPDEEMKEALGEMLAGCARHPEARLWYTEWQMRLKTDGTIIGSLDFKGPPDEKGEAEIGYGTDAAYRGSGYTTEAARALIDWAFSQSEGLFYIMAETAPDNAASQRVLEKLKFKPTGKTGGEGPRYELERPATSWAAIFMCLGLSVGVSFGTGLGNTSIGMCLGLACGLGLGSLLDAEENKKRGRRRAKRANTDIENVP